MVWPVGLVAIQAPFSEATTPTGTASVTTQRQDHLAKLVLDAHPRAPSSWRAAASSRMHQERRRLVGPPPTPSSVEEMRASEAGEISVRA